MLSKILLLTRAADLQRRKDALAAAAAPFEAAEQISLVEEALTQARLVLESPTLDSEHLSWADAC